MKNFKSFKGTITMIHDFRATINSKKKGCYKLMSVTNATGSLVNFVISPRTYFVNHITVGIGDNIIGFYDANVPVPLIFPPQYRAIVVGEITPYENITVDYFDENLVNSNNTLKLNITSDTEILLENDQTFNLNPKNRSLIVVYGPTTKSIPAQTIPYKIIVLC